MTLAFLQPWAGIKASDASINQTTSDGFRFGLHKQMIIASLSVGMQQTEQSCQLLCTFYLHFLVTRPATRTSHTCANYRNNVCLPLNLCVFECLCVCVWGRGGKTSGNNNTGDDDDDNDLQLHVFFTISRTSLDFGLADTLTAPNKKDGLVETGRL